MATDSTTQKTAIYKECFLKGVKICNMTGDSIALRYSTEPNASNYKHRDYTGQLFYSSAVGGTLFADYQGADAATIALKPWSFVERSKGDAVNRLDLTNIDILVMWGGYNDQNKDTPLGSSGTSDVTTFEGSIRTAYNNYMTRKPTLKLMLITPNQNPITGNNSLGLNLIDYRNRMISVCATLGIPCLDIYTETVLAGDVPDNVHPTNAWLESKVPLIGEFILDNL